MKEEAMYWWNGLLSGSKTRACDNHTDVVGHNRRWETLTEREIEILYQKEILGQ